MAKKKNYALEQYNKTQAEIKRLTDLVNIRQNYGYSKDDKDSYEAALAALNRKEGKGKKGFDIGTKIGELKAKNEALKKKLGSRQILQIPSISTGLGPFQSPINMTGIPGAKGKMVPNQYYVPALDPKSPTNLNKLRKELFSNNGVITDEDMEFAKGLSYEELKQEEAIQKQNKVNEATSAAQDQNWSNYQTSPTYDFGLGDGIKAELNITGNQPNNASQLAINQDYSLEREHYQDKVDDPNSVYNQETKRGNLKEGTANRKEYAISKDQYREFGAQLEQMKKMGASQAEINKRLLKIKRSPITSLGMEM